jgi:glycosyltransferase involved in cell wall biosynthesis
MSSRITIVTVVKNDRAGLAATLASVFEQSRHADEVIVVDGLSSDGTLELARSFSPRGVCVVEGPDRGIYDAMNKGLSVATGDYVWFLNAGDTLADASAISEVVDSLDMAPCHWLYGAAMPVDSRGLQCGPVLQGDCTIKSLRRGSVHVNHQAMIMSRTVLTLLQGFRLDFPLAAEYDLYLRALGITDARPIHRVLVHFRIGGASYQQRTRHIREMGRVRRELFQLSGLRSAKNSTLTTYLAWRAGSPLARISAVRSLRNSYLARRFGYG